MNYIKIQYPSQINTKSFKKQVEKLIREGVKTREILLTMEFFAPENVVMKIAKDFQVIKNQIAFKVRELEAWKQQFKDLKAD